MKEKKRGDAAKKSGLHPRNRNRTRYDFETLIKNYPELKQFVFINKYDHETIDFANPDGVKALNKVLLKHFYGISYWDIPKDYLCPPIPGRADYIHHIADLLGSCNANVIPLGRSITVLDIGVGANCIYPIIGNKEYGWRFVGSEIDPVAVISAKRIVELNNFPEYTIEIRTQSSPKHIFNGIVKPNEFFDISLCNPPYHSSLEQAETGTKRKWKNLGSNKEDKTILNFGGQSTEIQYEGGEAAFVKIMIEESVQFQKSVFWFSTILSKSSNLPGVYSELKNANALEIRTVDMAQGQKKSRFVAWTFLTTEEQKTWKRNRWIVP